MSERLLRWLVVATAIVITAAGSWVIGERLPINHFVFARLMALHDLPLIQPMILALLLAALPIRWPAWVTRIPTWLAENPAATAGVVALLLATGAQVIYRGSPLTMDEYSPWFQAHLFAQGRLTTVYDLDQLRRLFDPAYHGNFFVINWQTGEVASGYWPGMALLMTPFAAADLAWLCNPLLVALTLLALRSLGQSLTLSREETGYLLIFALASPAFSLNGISFYSMPAHLLMNTLFVICLADPKRRRPILAGVFGGLALTLHNPLPHLAFALPWLAWATIGQGLRRQEIARLVAGYLPPIVLLGGGWLLLAHNIRIGAEFAAAVPAEKVAAGLAARTSGLLSVFRWPDEQLLWFRAGGLIKLWMWAMPLLPLIALAIPWRSTGAVPRLLVASLLSSFVAYLFVPFSQGHGWGFRYLHGAWIAIPVMAVLALRDRRISDAMTSTLPTAWIAGALAFTPLHAWQIHDFISVHRQQMPGAVPTPKGYCDWIFHNRRGYFGIDLVQNAPGPGIHCRQVLLSEGRAADLAFAQDRAPGGEMIEDPIYGRTYRFPDRLVTNH